jgi:hypothetical protein
MRRLSRSLALVAAFGLCATLPANAAIFCVGDGPSLQNALSQAASNGEDDQIRLRAGTYSMGSGTTAFTFASSEAHRLALSGGWQMVGLIPCAFAFADPNLSVLDGANQRRVLDIANSSTNFKAMVEVRNLTIRGGSGSGFGGLRVSGGDNTRLDRLILRSNHATNSESPGGVLVTAVRGIEVTNSLILDNTCANGPCGAKLVTAQPVASVSVFNNTVARNRCPAIACPMAGILIDNVFSTLVANNAFHENEGAQIELAPANANATVLRNNRIDSFIGTPTQSIGNIVAPIPGFIDAANGNFRLRQDSLLLDAGDGAIGAGEIDLDGNARTIGRDRDIGAYELPYAVFADGFESDDN